MLNGPVRGGTLIFNGEPDISCNGFADNWEPTAVRVVDPHGALDDVDTDTKYARVL